MSRRRSTRVRGGGVGIVKGVVTARSSKRSRISGVGVGVIEILLVVVEVVVVAALYIGSISIRHIASKN